MAYNPFIFNAQTGSLGKDIPNSSASNFNQMMSQVGQTQLPWGQQYSSNPIQGALGATAPTGNTGTQNQNVSAPQQQNNQPSVPDYASQIRGSIDNQYNTYFQSLDAQLNDLNSQRSNNESMLMNSYNQSMSDLGAQKDQGLADLSTQSRKADEQQVKTLRDLTNNLKNQMTAGQVMLGSRGAGDSSAANQYSYALTQLGNKSRGDVYSQRLSIEGDINDRRLRLQNIYMQESKRLDTEKQNQILQISNWFSNAQSQLKQARATGEMGKEADLRQISTNLLNQALAGLQQVQAQTTSMKQGLSNWVLSNAKSLDQAITGLNTVASWQAPTVSANQVNGSIGQVGSNGQYYTYPGSNSQEKRDIFGNLIS